MASVFSDICVLAGLGAFNYGLYLMTPIAMWLGLGTQLVLVGVRIGRIHGSD